MDRELNINYHTFGCKVNTYDTGLLKKRMNGEGQKISAQGQVHVLNTCAVTAEATKEALRAIRKLKVQDPFSTIVVTGCAAQVDTEAFADLKGADLVIANSHKMQIPEILNDFFKGKITQKVFKSNIFKKDDLESEGDKTEDRTRTFIKIQDGCNSFCTYCVIPYARGKSRSISINELVQKIHRLHTEGVQEVVLTGVHIADYEDESLSKNNKLEDLVEHILLKTQIPRIRLTSLEPLEVSEHLLRLALNPRFCPHFHMSIQSANTKILSLMKRKYNQNDVISSLIKIREFLPQSYIGMDVIVGFPGESLEDFNDTVEALRKAPWTRLHVFPYSERPGTRALQIEGSVPWQERKRRASLLRQLSDQRFESEIKKQVGTLKQALVLKTKTKSADALSRDYWPVAIPEAKDFIANWAGEEIAVRVTGYKVQEHFASDGHLIAEVIEGKHELN